MRDTPELSIIVPAHNAAPFLERALGALSASDLPKAIWELIVVDDGSTDGTAIVAARYADKVVRLPGKPRGPAYARNRGVEQSSGKILIFLDADVVVHSDTLSRFRALLAARPEVGAVFGAYDTFPSAQNLVSHYRNLLHSYVHSRNPGPSETFWAGAGAVRREAFLEAGMYDEWHYPLPQIEDIELGARIREQGWIILLDPSIEVTHLKRWSLRGMLQTDFKNRGVPWARLLAHRGRSLRGGSLNVSLAEKFKTALAWVGVALVAGGLWKGNEYIALSGLSVALGVVALCAPFLRFLARVGGVKLMLAAIPLHYAYYLLNAVSFVVGVFLAQLIGPPVRDAVTTAYAEVGAERWPPVPRKGRSTWNE